MTSRDIVQVWVPSQVSKNEPWEKVVEAVAGGEAAAEAEESFFPASSTEMDGSAKLLLLYFCVSDMAVELQSQGQPVAELQVTGVKASFTKRPYDTNVALSVHSLLLVDAMQGPNSTE